MVWYSLSFRGLFEIPNDLQEGARSGGASFPLWKLRFGGVCVLIQMSCLGTRLETSIPVSGSETGSNIGHQFWEFVGSCRIAYCDAC